jgi:predicted metal-dependent peptidase
MAKSKGGSSRTVTKGKANFAAGQELVLKHPLFAPVARKLSIYRDDDCPADGWVLAVSTGYLKIHKDRVAESEQWAYVIAHGLLHFAFDHFVEHANPRAWATACDVFIAKFLADLKFGQAPDSMKWRSTISAQSEERLYDRFVMEGIPLELMNYGTAGAHASSIKIVPGAHSTWLRNIDYPARFAEGLADAAQSAVNVVGGLEPYLGAGRNKNLITAGQLARRWFINSYPLLGAMAASFELIEDVEICNRMDITIAAVHPESREIYLNPKHNLSLEQTKFVMAHEFLHAGLRHDVRCQGRDHYLWNIACDYVINGWIYEMEIGSPPDGLCFDPSLKGMSAESVYDLIVTDLRRFRKIKTLRGSLGDFGDILPASATHHKDHDGCSLDDFYRRCLAQGLTYHETIKRGFLPANLVEEIRALSQPPIPWDVELANWFDRYFPPKELVHTYARPSRRQSSSPDIPRPRYCAGIPEDARTFGVILDTSGSMDRTLLAKALGAIASYSISRDVPMARLIFCDAMPYDEGYVSPESIAGRVRVRGRGGTTLQPAVDLLQNATDFPEKGPLLIITDGFCDTLRIHRDHAFLMPPNAMLPFATRGEIFRIE